MIVRDRYETRPIDGKRIRVVETETGREEGVWNYKMQEWFPNETDRHELYVEPAHAWQDLACPSCGESFRDVIREDSRSGGIYCNGCGGRIVYVFDRDRGDQTEDKTEQATLVPDGGRCKTPYLGTDDDLRTDGGTSSGGNDQCPGCGSPAWIFDNPETGQTECQRCGEVISA